MAKRRRRRQVAWFPNLGTEGTDSNTKLSIATFYLEPHPDNVITRRIIPLTWDQPIDEATVGPETTSLADLQGSAYHVTRIVGAFQAAYSAVGDAEAPVPCAFAAALAVIPWDEFSNTPEADVNPLSAQDIREPWIWRRYWTFGTGDLFQVGDDPFSDALLQFPSTTSLSPQSRGEFLDQSTSRRVSGDERLCLCVAAAQLNRADFIGGEPPTPPADGRVLGTLDYRILGSLRKARNDGTVR